MSKKGTTKQDTEQIPPGIMLYSDLMESLEEYDLDERAEFIYAMRDYRFYGTEPYFEDRGLRALWKQAKRSMEKDVESYNDKCRRNRYNAFVGAIKRKLPEEQKKNLVEGVDYPSYDDWVMQIDEQAQATATDRKRPLPDGCQQEIKQEPQQELQQEPQQKLQQELQTEVEREGEMEGVQGKPRGRENRTTVIDAKKERRDELYLEWRVAMASKELRKAGELSNRLYALGYNVDPVTHELRER